MTGRLRGRIANARRERATAWERGFTLIECAIALWVVSAIMVGLLSALLTMTQSSDLARRITLAETAIHEYIEAVRDAPYVNCPTQTVFGVPYGSVSAWTSPESSQTGLVRGNIATVKLWDPNGGDPDPSKNFAANAPAGYCASGKGDAGAQQLGLLITVWDSTGHITYSSTQTIVKRNNAVGP